MLSFFASQAIALNQIKEGEPADTVQNHLGPASHGRKSPFARVL
jgi:hypothetical protein